MDDRSIFDAGYVQEGASDRSGEGPTGPAPAEEPDGEAAHRPKARLAPWQVKLAMELMRSHPGEKLVLDAVAARLDLSVNHFIKAFRGTEGVAPYRWFMRERIEYAKRLLREDVLTIARVAHACGFADQSHFTKAFTRIVGMSPGKWRQGAREDDAGGDAGPARDRRRKG